MRYAAILLSGIVMVMDNKAGADYWSRELKMKH